MKEEAHLSGVMLHIIFSNDLLSPRLPKDLNLKKEKEKKKKQIENAT
jgi:hypothetical protein